MAIREIPLSYEIKDIDLDIDVSLFPKEPLLRYKFVIRNSGKTDIEIESIRAKIYLLGIIDICSRDDISIPSSDKVEIEVEKKVLNLFDFGNTVFNYFVNPSVKEYRIRGLARIDGDLYRVKGNGKQDE
jgi:hypothetical protein